MPNINSQEIGFDPSIVAWVPKNSHGSIHSHLPFLLGFVLGQFAACPCLQDRLSDPSFAPCC